MTFRYRTWAAHGGHLLPQIFVTPTEAGRWRRERFGCEEVPLTLIAMFNNGRQTSVTPSELCAYQFALYRPDLERQWA
jgi:hypothetical protein